jgi:hypothetical protein
MSFQLRPVTEKEAKTINRLASLDEPALYTELGQEIGTFAPGEAPETAGRGWVARRVDQIHDRICRQGDYCNFIKTHRNAQAVEIIASLSDLLTTIAGGLPVYTLATLVFKFGLNEFCHCDE